MQLKQNLVPRKSYNDLKNSPFLGCVKRDQNTAKTSKFDIFGLEDRF